MAVAKNPDLDAVKAKNWTGDSRAISKKFVFAGFAEAFGFMGACVPEIEKLNHHPEWSNVYDSVTVKLTTHDAGGVTAKDIELARIMDTIAEKFPPKR